MKKAAEGGPGAAYTGDVADMPMVGVLGGGQLGKMFATAAAQMGVPVRVLDPTEGSPASVVAEHVVGGFRDADAIQSFAAGLDILTVEIEHVDAGALEQVEGGTCEVHPSPQTLRIIQDKQRQKEHFTEAGVATAAFRGVGNQQELLDAGETFGWPLMLKSRTLAYDGRGNAVVRGPEGAAAAAESLGGFEHGLYAEQWAPYVKELAVMVARGRDGATAAFPVTETVHQNSICWVTETPAAVPPAVAAAAAELAQRAVQSLPGAGIFGVELFLLETGELLLNEVAPRPHNSGHYTIEGCDTSQYEQHLRAVLGWPLGSTDLKVGSAIMLNLLGEQQVSSTQGKIQRALETPGASVHWYGKAGVTPGRKVGHITLTAPTPQEARRRLAAIEPAAAEALASSAASGSDPASSQQPKVGIIMGSDSDLATMKAAAAVLDDFGVPCEVTVVSAHRTPDRMLDYARSAAGRGLKAIIAGAGGAAHLPGMVAALTPLPVIGVPVKPAGAHLDGLDALLSIVQMPRGVPVATVAIGNAANAGLLAVRVLAASDPALRKAMEDYQGGMRDTVLGKAGRLESQGWADYQL
eukprot:CAMPEP_0206146038 /NCGR_PEP_ID=MMETSP1473-20131121/29309_1 /ASSEMBLY_ACC=CAM_ASM_001109 /TAXON_ID=1461547 /ORGANISM="Stichococcus sp, Strain RCC1054" /LENGTH=580 /DNA_ID=CAMNT_0053542467 /DNA_START=392 /DNA_END=2134 /DNA_ORIENTATION=+